MKVDVNINKNDYWNYNKFMVKNIGKFTRMFIVNMMLMPFTALVVLIMIKKSIPVIIFGTIGAGIIGDLFLICIAKRQVLKELDKKEGVLGEHTFEIYSQNLKEVTSKGNKLYSWSMVKDIDKDKSYIYIFLGGANVKIIPKRCFSSIEECEKFYVQALKNWESKKEKN